MAKRKTVQTIIAASALMLASGFVGRMTAPVKTVTEYKTITVTETVEVTKKESPDVPEKEVITYYNVPLDHDLQDYIYTLCEEEGVPMSLIIAMIDHESTFQSRVISKTGDYGLMQINICNHENLRKTYGITDFLDPYQNVLCGIKMIGALLDKYETIEKALMAYQMGEGSASRQWANGVYSTKYTRSLIDAMNRYEREVASEQ